MFNIFNIFSSNDEGDFNVLYKKYYKLSYSIAASHLNNQDDIEECIQDVFMYVVDNFDKIRKSSEKERKNYLATVTNGFAINKFKKEIRYASSLDVDDEYVQNVEIGPSEFDDYNAKEIALVIDKLSAIDKNYLYLTYIYGYTSREIANMYSVKDTYVRKRLQFSKNFLRKELSLT